MSEWFKPVERVGDVVVVGERHRDRGSGRLVNAVLEEYDIEGVCVEVGPETGYRGNGGGAVGESLVWAEDSEVPRFYVDESVNDVIEAFGSRRRAYRYLKALEDDIPNHEDGLIEKGMCREVREDFREEYGEDSFDLLFSNREQKMAGRARWASDEVGGCVLLVVGAAHFNAILSLLKRNVEHIEISESRHRYGERVAAGAGPWTTMFIFMGRGLREIDWPSWSDFRASLGLE